MSKEIILEFPYSKGDPRPAMSAFDPERNVWKEKQ